MSLEVFGRGRESQGSRTLELAFVHLIGAAAGGGAVGLLVGMIGWRVGATGRPVIAAVLVFLLVVAALWRRHPHLGLSRQVPRRWPTWVPLPIGYLLWGGMLGSGVMTVIPFSSFLGVLALEFVSVPWGAALVGAAYGLAREAPAAVAFLNRAKMPFDPSTRMTRVVSLRGIDSFFNLGWLIVTTAALSAMSWHGSVPW
jgi:hypothetical protein